MDTLLAWAVVVLPTGLAIVIELASPEVRKHKFWRIGVIALGIAISGLTFWQQVRTAKAAAKDRLTAIEETSKRVVKETAERVTDSMKQQYEGIVKELKQDNESLRNQLTAQGKSVDAIRSSNIVTGKNPLKVEVTNPPGRDETPKPTEIKAFPRGIGQNKEGLFETEITLIPNVAIPPPVTIELEFDYPIVGVSTRPLPTPAALMAGGDRWHGTRAFATLPSLGISPNQVWVTTIKSSRPINLVKPPHLRTGY